MPKRVDRSERRAAILDAAVRVFARQGFAASRVEDVAAEAGISKGSVYLYFESRDELLRASFESFAARTNAALASLGDGPPLERLARLIRGMVEVLAAHPDHARVLLDVWASMPPLDMAAIYRATRSAIASLLEEAQTAGDVRAGVGQAHAMVIVGAIEGCMVQWLADPQVPMAEMAEPIVEVCLEGVRA